VRGTVIVIFIVLSGTQLLQGGLLPRFDDGFGYSRWGASGNDVKQVFELAHSVQRASAKWENGRYTEYTYTDSMANMEYRVFPEFVHDSLYAIMLMFKLENRSDSAVASAFRSLEENLFVEHDMYDMQSPQQVPIADGIDHAWFTVWSKRETEISLFLVKYGEGEFDLGVSYVCAELERLYDPMPWRADDSVLSLTASELGVTELAIARAKWMLKLDECEITKPRPSIDRMAKARPVDTTIPVEEKISKPDEFVAIQQMPTESYHHSPDYPEKAKSWGESAVVWVQALVDKDGKVENAVILQSSGRNLGFDEAALEAAYKNEYRPAIQGGEPVPVWVSYKVEFKPPKK
jgi:TonB family protein